jgi:hypothetical protein
MEKSFLGNNYTTNSLGVYPSRRLNIIQINIQASSIQRYSQKNNQPKHIKSNAFFRLENKNRGLERELVTENILKVLK